MSQDIIIKRQGRQKTFLTVNAVGKGGLFCDVWGRAKISG